MKYYQKSSRLNWTTYYPGNCWTNYLTSCSLLSDKWEYYLTAFSQTGVLLYALKFLAQLFLPERPLFPTLHKIFHFTLQVLPPPLVIFPRALCDIHRHNPSIFVLSKTSKLWAKDGRKHDIPARWHMLV